MPLVIFNGKLFMSDGKLVLNPACCCAWNCDANYLDCPQLDIELTGTTSDVGSFDGTYAATKEYTSGFQPLYGLELGKEVGAAPRALAGYFTNPHVEFGFYIIHGPVYELGGVRYCRYLVSFYMQAFDEYGYQYTQFNGAAEYYGENLWPGACGSGYDGSLDQLLMGLPGTTALFGGYYGDTDKYEDWFKNANVKVTIRA